jgi:predicted membrane protein DUF2142
MRRNVLTRLAVGWALLAAAWVFANPPFAAPDEMDHFVRTVGIAEGQLIGAPAPDVNIGADAAEIRFDKSTQRAVMVPADLNPTPFNCYIANPLLSAACLRRSPLHGSQARLITSVGDYPPLGLLAPAAVIRSAHDPLQADRLGRVAAVVVALALLIAAAAAVFDPEDGWLSLVGVLATCTPTAIFLAGSLNPSGLSVAAGIGMSASLLRIGRPSSTPAWVWTLLGVSGAALVLSHPTGLLWAAFLLVGFIAFEGVATVRRLLHEQARAASLGIGLLAAGIVAGVVWQELYGPITPIAYRAIRTALSRAPGQTWNGLRDVVAGFGYLEFRLPLPVYLLWFAFVGALGASAARVGGRRERRAVLAAGVLAILIAPAIWMVFGRAAGIGINGREYMPVLVAFPMLCAEVLYRNRARISSVDATVLASLATIAAILQFIAWYLNGRRSAVGTGGPLLFASHAGWSPPLGWVPWLAVSACGALLLASVSLGRLWATRKSPAAATDLRLPGT